MELPQSCLPHFEHGYLYANAYYKNLNSNGQSKLAVDKPHWDSRWAGLRSPVGTKGLEIDDTLDLSFRLRLVISYIKGFMYAPELIEN